jgi:hypothetical protein
MATALKQSFDIVVLKIELERRARSSDGDQDLVIFTLQYHQDGGELLSLDPVEALLATIVLTDVASLEPEFAFPPDVADTLRHMFNSVRKGIQALWIHLVRPYGPLGLVPWEHLLGSIVETPILMLPDFIFPKPREDTATLRVALFASAPLRTELGPAIDAVSHLIENIRVADRTLTFDVFADDEIANGLRNGAMGSNARVSIHAPSDSPIASNIVASETVEGDALRSPWLRWIRQALVGRSVDVIHFVCHCAYLQGTGYLLFAAPRGERSRDYLSGKVGPRELSHFLTQSGAWACVLSSLEDSRSVTGLRAIADVIAQTRPGPVMLHPMCRDPDGVAISAGYSFLFSSSSLPPSWEHELYISCQPYLAASLLGNADPRVLEATRVPTSELGQSICASAAGPSPFQQWFAEGGPEPTGLIAATERMAEQIQLQCQVQADAQPPEFTDFESIQAALKTVDLLRENIAREELGGDFLREYRVLIGGPGA